MGTNDPNLKRISVLLLVLVFMMVIYACKSILLNDAEDYSSLTGDVEQNAKSTRGINAFNVIGMVLSFVGFMIGLFFIDIPSLSWYLSIFLVPIYTILLFVFWLLAIDIILDIFDKSSDIITKIVDAIIPG